MSRHCVTRTKMRFILSGYSQNKSMRTLTSICVNSGRIIVSFRSMFFSWMDFYHPTTKLQKGTVFSCVCQSVHEVHRQGSSLPLDMFKLVHYVAWTSVSKRAVGIRLKCLLVVKRVIRIANWLQCLWIFFRIGSSKEYLRILKHFETWQYKIRQNWHLLLSPNDIKKECLSDMTGKNFLYSPHKGKLIPILSGLRRKICNLWSVK